MCLTSNASPNGGTTTRKKKHRGDAEHCRNQIHFLQSNKLILIESQKALELIDCRILSVCKNNNCLC